MRGAADEILAVLKDDRLQDPVRKQQVEDLINSVKKYFLEILGEGHFLKNNYNNKKTSLYVKNSS